MTNTIDLTTSHGCAQWLIDRRVYCRRVTILLDAIHDDNHRDRRQAKKLRETKNPFLIRKADTLDAQVETRTVEIRKLADALREIGGELMELSSRIDTKIAQSLLLDLLNVNSADRSDVLPEDGIINFTYVKSLEDSAMYRGSDCKKGPLAQAVMLAISHELAHNEQLKKFAHEHLFGIGGMFEFLPMYQQNSSGDMVRMPPKLRLADECDAKGATA